MTVPPALKRAALYARYSTDKQNPRSALAQLAAMRLLLPARGWREVAAFADEGISGGVIANRDMVQEMMEQAALGRFDVVFVEALDRFSRGQADVARLFEMLEYHGVELHSLNHGRINELHIGLEGTMNRLEIVKLGAKTRRGLIDRVNEGFSGGGRCYGYDVAPGGETGVLAINPDEAAIIVRVYEAYAGGASVRSIVHRLNAEHVPAPRGGTWGPTALHGDRRTGDGILCQELYVGVRVFNRRRFRKHPETGRRTSILNPPDVWIRQPVPQLRIVGDDLWKRVQDRGRAIAAMPPAQRRKPKRLLSGLLKCVLCGGAMTLQGQKYACASHRERGTCPNAKIIRAETVEIRVLEGIRTRLLAPDKIAEAMLRFQEEQNRARRDAMRQLAPMERELEEVGRRLGRLVDSYERGILEIDELEARVAPLKIRRAELQDALDAAGVDATPVRLHHAAAQFYRDLTEDLVGALNAEDGEEGREMIRSVIDRVDFHPRPGLGNFELEVHGKLAALLGVSERAAAASDCEVVVGAGTRSGRNLTPLRVSFAA